MTLNEWAMFIAGVCWGMFIIPPVWNALKKIWTEAKNAKDEW